MKKILILLLLVTMAFPMKSVGMYGDRFALVSDNYAAMVPADLSQETMIQNSYGLTLIPRVNVNDVAADMVTEIPIGLFDNAQDKYVVEKSTVANDVEISEKVSFLGDTIVIDLAAKNAGPSAVSIDFLFPIKSTIGNFAVFSPENYDNRTANYLVFLRPAYDGPALAFIASQEIKPSFLDILESAEYPVYFSLSALNPGETFSLQIKLMPFALRKSAVLDYPLDLYAFMGEPLIRTTGSVPDEALTGGADEKITAMMDKAGQLAKGESQFYSIHDVELEGASFDSLGSSVYFKQLCIKNGVPCRLVIGENDGSLYAWVQAYDGNWVDIDVQNSVRQKPEYSVLYLEPKLEVHTMPFSDDSKEMVYQGTAWIGTMGQTGFLVYFIIIIVIGSLLVVLFLSKKMVLGKIMANKGTIGKTEMDFDGKYEVLSEEIDDSFLREIIKRIRDKDGIVNVSQLVETMHFSKELVQDGIAYLMDQKFIKKIM